MLQTQTKYKHQDQSTDVYKKSVNKNRIKIGTLNKATKNEYLAARIPLITYHTALNTNGQLIIKHFLISSAGTNNVRNKKKQFQLFKDT
jgi:hypothetical protein